MQNQKLFLALAIATFTTSFTAQADGFRCRGQKTGLQVAVYNHVTPQLGTRTPAVMIVSDPSAAFPEKTIAKFSAENGTLSFLGYGRYQGTVKFSLSESQASAMDPNAFLAGTSLGKLRTIELQAKFSYYHAASANTDKDALDGKLVYNTVNGETIEEKAFCSRYLKH